LSRLAALEAEAQRIGQLVGKTLPPGVGFALVIFDFGQRGHITYVSNAEQASMMNALKELQVNIALGQVQAPGGPDVPGVLG
jgi:hypothetical protein